jgi:hypothetical protein
MFQVYEAIDTRDGASCAELVSFKHPHVANPRLQVGGSYAHGVQRELWGSRFSGEGKNLSRRKLISPFWFENFKVL